MAVWKAVPQLPQEVTTVPDAVGREIELKHLIKTHEDIVAIIEANIQPALPDPELLKEIAAYVRHVAVCSALRSTNTYNLNPFAVGEPLPPRLSLPWKRV